MLAAAERWAGGEGGERHNHRADYCLARTLAAIAVLGAHPEGLRVVELAAEIGVSRATAYRDVAVMRRAGVPLERVAQPGDVARWRLTTK